jgi:hypothetical protein
MWFVKQPEYYDVIVTENLFGDVITDLAAIMSAASSPAATSIPKASPCSSPWAAAPPGVVAAPLEVQGLEPGEAAIVDGRVVGIALGQVEGLVAQPNGRQTVVPSGVNLWRTAIG